MANRCYAVIRNLHIEVRLRGTTTRLLSCVNFLINMSIIIFKRKLRDNGLKNAVFPFLIRLSNKGWMKAGTSIFIENFPWQDQLLFSRSATRPTWCQRANLHCYIPFESFTFCSNRYMQTHSSSSGTELPNLKSHYKRIYEVWQLSIFYQNTYYRLTKVWAGYSMGVVATWRRCCYNVLFNPECRLCDMTRWSHICKRASNKNIHRCRYYSKQ